MKVKTVKEIENLIQEHTGWERAVVYVNQQNILTVTLKDEKFITSPVLDYDLANNVPIFGSFESIGLTISILEQLKELS